MVGDGREPGLTPERGEPSGVGEVIDGPGAAGADGAGVTGMSAGGCTAGAAGSRCSIAGACGAELLSSRFIAILAVESRITTTLAPTSSERILEVMVDGWASAAPVAGAVPTVEVVDAAPHYFARMR